jgi:methyl-accepting chemotaxis protein
VQQGSLVTKATEVQTKEIEELSRIMSDISEVVSLNNKELEKTLSVTKELIGYADEIKQALAEFER